MTTGDVVVDLKARQIAVGSEIAAPDDRGGRARVTWLTRQRAYSIEHFYTSVLQHVTVFQPKAPHVVRASATYLDARDEPAALSADRSAEITVTPAVQPATPWHWQT